LADLRHLTALAVGRLSDKFHGLDRRIEGLKALDLADRDAHDLTIRAVDCRAITRSDLVSIREC
jgi:hypothetical protein